jgi:aminoglycoside phosphotransferase (APT) family kinase protein
MPSVREHDLAATREQLQQWFVESLGVDLLAFSELHIPETGGNVNDTFLFRASWVADGERTEAHLVCRAEPMGYSNLQTNDVLDQARTLEALGRAPELPVPRVVAIEADARWLGRPFFLMEAIPGRPAADVPPYTVTGWLAEATPEQQRSVYRQSIDSLATLHRVDPFAIGLGHLDRGGDETSLASQLRRFREFHLWGSDGTKYEVLEAAFDWLTTNYPDDRAPAVINWNDARLGNMLFEGTTLRAMLDWELIELGPPEVDLAWFLWHDRFMAESFGSEVAGRPVAQLPGAPTLEQGAAWYAEASGHEPRDMAWFEMFAAYRMGVYLMRHGKGLIATGKAAPDSGVDHVNSASVELGRMLARR